MDVSQSSMRPRSRIWGAVMLLPRTTKAAHPEWQRTPSATWSALLLGPPERAIMLKTGDARPSVIGKGAVDVGDDDVGVDRGFRENLTPRRDDQRVSVRPAPICMGASLRRRDHVCSILDSACAKQGVPMRAAGCFRKCGRNAQNERAALRELSVELRKAQIVANREPQCAPR